ncbi:MAG: isocitrate lyase/PEP mutase family protein [Desulfobacterales bacterium]|nr:isocitrate lyase/PEP mutase family protein [Desulfobacterales bacterium]
METKAKKLRELIDRPGPIFSLGVWDPYSAIIAEQAGFEVLTVFGSITSWAMIGKPDLGYITQTEMVDTARRVVQSVSTPVIVDCDDGFGDPINVIRTIKLIEQIGAAGLYIEDLSRPLRCSAMGEGGMIPSDVMAQKIRAAVDARTDPDFVIIARTDAYEGADEMIVRARKYVEAGADMVLTIGLLNLKDMKKVATEAGVPLATLQAARTKMPFGPPNEVAKMGYKIIFHVQTLFMAADHSMRQAARELMEDIQNGDETPRLLPGQSPVEIEKGIGLDEDDVIINSYFGVNCPLPKQAK